MPVSKDEQEAVDALKAKQHELREQAFSMFRTFLRATPAELKTYGHATADSAIRSTITRTLVEIDRATQEFLSKWPD